MTEQQRQQFTAFISTYLTKMLTQEITDIETVPSLIRDAVREDFEDREKFVPIYVAQYEAGVIDEIPILLREQGMELVELNRRSNVGRYIAKVVNGEIDISDVPFDLRDEVRDEVEKMIGKKL